MGEGGLSAGSSKVDTRWYGQHSRDVLQLARSLDPVFYHATSFNMHACGATGWRGLRIIWDTTIRSPTSLLSVCNALNACGGMVYNMYAIQSPYYPPASNVLNARGGILFGMRTQSNPISIRV